MSAVTQSSLKHYKVKIWGLEIFKKRTSNRKGVWGGRSGSGEGGGRAGVNIIKIY